MHLRFWSISPSVDQDRMVVPLHDDLSLHLVNLNFSLGVTSVTVPIHFIFPSEHYDTLSTYFTVRFRFYKDVLNLDETRVHDDLSVIGNLD